jgi:hypothetical protein
VPTPPRKQPVPLDGLTRQPHVDPSENSGVRVDPAQVITCARRCEQDPSYQPTPDEVPLVGTDLDHVLDHLQRHELLDGIDLFLLAQRVVDRNREILRGFTSNGVDVLNRCAASGDPHRAQPA